MFLQCFRYHVYKDDPTDPESHCTYDPDLDDVVYINISSIIYVEPMYNDIHLAWVKTLDNYFYLTKDLEKVLSHFYLEF